MNRYHLMFQMDIGLVPLNDIPFNQAKSFIKGLEYTASGIPFVAEATGEYQLLAADGVGSVASSPEEWASRLSELLDYKTRKRDAATAFHNMEQKHTIKQREDEWRQAIIDIAA
jgi:hypothetical protein